MVTFLYLIHARKLLNTIKNDKNMEDSSIQQVSVDGKLIALDIVLMKDSMVKERQPRGGV